MKQIFIKESFIFNSVKCFQFQCNQNYIQKQELLQQNYQNQQQSPRQKMQRTPIMKKCSKCYGFGYTTYVVTKYEWNHLSKRNDLKSKKQNQTCFRCSGKGQEIDQQAEKQWRRMAQEKQNKFQQYKDKEKKFEEYIKQYQINKPLLDNIDEQFQQNYSVPYQNPRVKSQAQLRAQFEKKYSEQQLQARRLQSQRKRQQEERKRAQRIEAQQKQRQERQKWEKQWQERKKTPQGMKQWQRIQNKIKWDDRKQLCCDCLKCAVKIICCGSPSCGRVISWGVVIFIIVIWIVIWNWAPGSRS